MDMLTITQSRGETAMNAAGPGILNLTSAGVAVVPAWKKTKWPGGLGRPRENEEDII
jgi:hypothetical protein